MPKKLSLILQKLPKLKNLLKISRKNKQNEGGETLNLLASVTEVTQNILQIPRPIKIYRQIILVILLSFSLGLFIDNRIQRRLYELKSELDLAEENVWELVYVEDLARDLDKKIHQYQYLLEKRAIFTSKLESVLAPLSSSDVSKISIRFGDFSVSTVESSPYTAARLIGTYLEDENIDYILLQSASFDVKNKNVQIELKGGFR
ncbi:hypothetical protein JXA34_03820 [Patescibacteria group bacterium]|nr:hypothetical protein [Patescibacteria group bacterium]